MLDSAVSVHLHNGESYLKEWRGAMRHPRPKKRRSTTRLSLSGERVRDRFEVLFDSVCVHLPATCLMALVDLVAALANADAGYVHVNSVTICRLRRYLGRALGKGAGVGLIETGCGDEYRLAIPPERAKKQIHVKPGFFELAKQNLISPDQFEALRRFARRTPSSEIQMKSKGNRKEIDL